MNLFKIFYALLRRWNFKLLCFNGSIR